MNAYETSAERGQPVELYKFVYGTEAGREYFYTNADQDITVSGDVYKAIPLDRDKIKTKGRAEGKEITVEVPMTSEIAELFRIFPPGRVVTVTIRQGHLPTGDGFDAPDDGTNFPVIWTGRVLESRRNDNSATLTCESSESGMKRVGLRRHYQWPCPLVLYSTRCGADKDAAKRQTTASAITGNSLTLPSGWNGASAVGSFLGGLVEWDSANGREFRTIIGVSGDVLKLNAAPSGLAVSDDVDVFLGCPHTLEACGTLHDNEVNYGGQPFIPLKNPVGKNNHT